MILLLLLLAVIGVAAFLLIKMNKPVDTPIQQNPNIPSEPVLPVKPIKPGVWNEEMKNIKGLHILNEASHYDDKLMLHLQYNDGVKWTYGNVEYGMHTGVIEGSNTWNLASGNSFINIGWLDSIEFEGNYKIYIWASPTANTVNLKYYTPVDGYETFIGYGEGVDIININDSNAGVVNIIDEYTKRHLNGDGSNYYFYIRISNFA